MISNKQYIKLVHNDDIGIDHFVVSKKNAVNGQQTFKLPTPVKVNFKVFRDTQSGNELYLYVSKEHGIFVWSNVSQQDAFRRLKGHLFEKFFKKGGVR